VLRKVSAVSGVPASAGRSSLDEARDAASEHSCSPPVPDLDEYVAY